MSGQHFNLLRYYNHWDRYVRNWAYGEIPGQDYMPEPWWGWTPMEREDGSREELHCVVINMNPGKGGKLQTIPCMNCVTGCVAATDYSKSMARLRAHLEATERWHHKRRYTPIMKALGIEKGIVSDTLHYLGIELLPDHQIENFSEKVEEKAEEIYDYVLSFAARASMEITSPDSDESKNPLGDVVIMRAAPKYLDLIINKLNKAGDKYKDRIEKDTTPYPSDKQCPPSIYHFKGLSRKVYIACITGARNMLPISEIKAALERIDSIKKINQ